MIDRETGEVIAMVDMDALTRPFPESARKSRKGANNRLFTYVDGTTVIHRLIEATGNNYSFSVDKYWSQDGARLALVTLSIPGLGARSHIGIQAEQQGQGEDALAKGAITDGLKKAATLFGVGLELYGPDLNAGESQGTAPDQAQRMTNLAQGPQRPASAPTPIRQPGQAMEAIREVSGAHNLNVREDTRPSPRAQQQVQQQDGRDAYPYQQIFERKTDMAAVNDYLAECRLRGGNKGECIRAVNDYAQRTHGAQGDVVIGTGAWNEQYKRNDVYPMDIANALGHYVAQESTAGASEAKAAAERETTNDDEWDDVPF